jgi:hypothetical protein
LELRKGSEFPERTIGRKKLSRIGKVRKSRLSHMFIVLYITHMIPRKV